MRKSFHLIALASVMMSLCIPVCAQQPQSDSIKVLPDELIEKVKAYDNYYYKLEKGILHIQIIDSDYFKERSWSPLPGDPTEGTARIRINYHPGKDATFIIRHSPDDIRQSGR